VLVARHYAIATDKDDGTSGSEETAGRAAKLTTGRIGGSLRRLYVHGYCGGIVFANSSTHLKTERVRVRRGSFKAIEFNKLTEHRKAVRNLRDLGRRGFSPIGNDPGIRHHQVAEHPNGAVQRRNAHFANRASLAEFGTPGKSTTTPSVI
jgi:hypothetical protein